VKLFKLTYLSSEMPKTRPPLIRETQLPELSRPDPKLNQRFSNVNQLLDILKSYTPSEKIHHS